MKAKRIPSEEILKTRSKILLDLFISDVMPLLRDSGLILKKTTAEDIQVNPELYKLASTVHSIALLYYRFNKPIEDEVRMKIWETLSKDISLEDKDNRLKELRTQNSTRLDIHASSINDILQRTSNSRDEIIQNWPTDLLKRYESFFADDVNGRVYYKIPKVRSIRDITHDLERDYDLEVIQTTEGSFRIKRFGVETATEDTVRAEAFLQNGAKALGKFAMQISEFSDEEFEILKQRLTSCEYNCFSERKNLKEVKNKNITQTLGILFRNPLVYEVFITELNNHPIKDLQNFIGSANNIAEKFHATFNKIHNFTERHSDNYENTQADNSYDTVVFSRNPRDIATMSTYRSWASSCMSVYKEEGFQYLPAEIQEGSFVIYATTRDDIYLTKIKARTLGRTYISDKGEGLFKSFKFYGNVANILEFSQEIMDNDLNTNQPVFFKGHISPKVYFDGWPKEITEFSKKLSTEEFLKSMNVNYRFNEDGKIIVDGDIDLIKYEGESLEVLKDIDQINGNLTIKNSEVLKSLKGCPENITGTLSIFNNSALINMRGFPKSGNVAKTEIKANPNLVSLKGMPETLNGWLQIASNPKLDSHKGISQTINGHFSLAYSNFKHLKHAPKETSGNFVITQCVFAEGKELIWNTTMSKKEAETKLKPDLKLRDKIVIKSTPKKQVRKTLAKKIKILNKNNPVYKIN